jgi:toxin ParE1/3/4
LTARIIVTETASIDQASILQDLGEKAGVRTAIKFRSRFRALYDRLADHPASGPRRPALGPDIRIGIVTPYIVIYR